MSRRGDDDGGFHPHPGDPWHPGWSSDAAAEPDAAAGAEPEDAGGAGLEGPSGTPVGGGEAPAAAPPRRRRLGRGKRRERPAADRDRLPVEPEPVPPAAEDAEISGWWAAGAPAGETTWPEPAAVPPAAAEESLEEGEAAPAPPSFPWWETAVPPTAPASAPVAPATLQAGADAAEEEAARREQPSAASVVPLDVPERPVAPPPLPASDDSSSPGWWEESAGGPDGLPIPPLAPAGEVGPDEPAMRPPEVVEVAAGPADLPLDVVELIETPAVWPGESAEGGFAEGASAEEFSAEEADVAADLERAAAALLAEMGEEPAVAPLEADEGPREALPGPEAVPADVPGEEAGAAAPGPGAQEALPWVEVEPEAVPPVAPSGDWLASREGAGLEEPALEEPGLEEPSLEEPALEALPWVEVEPEAVPPVAPSGDWLASREGAGLEEPALEEPSLEEPALEALPWVEAEPEGGSAFPRSVEGATGAEAGPADTEGQDLLVPLGPVGALAPPEEESLDGAAAGLVLPAWEPSAAGPAAAAAEGPAAEGEAVDEAIAADADVDAWLAFVEGVPAVAVPPARPPVAPEAAPAPVGDWEMEGEAPSAATSRPRRRGWFGRRRRRRAGTGEEWPERAWAGEEEEAAEEAPTPPPWPAAAADEPGGEEAVVAAGGEEDEAEAAWAAWEAGAPEAPAAGPAPAAGEPGTAAVEDVAGAGGMAAADTLEDEAAAPEWEEADWAGEPAPAAEGWFGEVDEDEVEVPSATLPEEEWEEAGEPARPAPPPSEPWPDAVPAAAAEPGVATADELAAEGWEAFPVLGEPLPREAGAPPSAGAAQEGVEGWETFPEPGALPVRPDDEAAPPPRVSFPVPGPVTVLPADEEPAAWEQHVPQDEPEPVFAEFDEGEPEPDFYEDEGEAGEGPAPWGGAPADQPTQEMPAPVFDFERPPRRQEPISEEILTGAVTMEHRGLAEEMAAADTAETELQALSAPMPGVELGVVGFEDVAHLSSDEEMVAPARSDLPMRVATGMVLAALLLGSLWVGGEFLAGFVGLLAVVGLGELYGSLRRHGYQPLALFGFLGGIGLLAGMWFYGPVAIAVAAVATTVLSFFYYAFAPGRRDALTNGGLTILGMLWVTGTIAFAFPIATAPDFRVLILAVAATVIATDVGAYFTGRAWGRRRMAPVLSPHKTWEGLAGGVVLGIGAAVAAGYFFDEIGIRTGAALGLVVAVMAPLGDLAESMVKRSLGVKDMGSILPGHGGILDRIDAFLFVLPGAWVLFETMGLLH